MKHAHVPLRRMTEPRVCEDDALDDESWPYGPQGMFDEQVNEGDEVQQAKEKTE